MFENTTTKTLFTAVVIGGLFYLGGQYIASQPQRLSQESDAEREISVQGKGEVSAKPDVAKITLGVTTGPQSSAQVATDMLGKKFNDVVAVVQEKGVAEDDIKTTNLTVNPVYDYSSGQQNLKGYEASESIEVKIRKLDSVGEVLSAATTQGVNQAGGIVFEIDKPEALQEEAQTMAIKDARERADRLAQALGTKIGKIKTFNADVANPPMPGPVFSELKEADRGEDTAPQVPAGTNNVVATVTVTFELR